MKNRKIDVFIIVLFILTTSLGILIGELYLNYFKNVDSISKSDFTVLLFWSIVKSIIIDSGIIVIYYINKKRINNGKSVI